MRCTKRLEFDAGHRLVGHEGLCNNYHGHRYAVEFTFGGDLDVLGRVIDFSVIKSLFGGWLNEHWDHAMILQVDDPLVPWLRNEGMRVYTLTSVPTAEAMAQHLLTIGMGFLLPSGVRLQAVRVYETPTSYAEVSA